MFISNNRGGQFCFVLFVCNKNEVLNIQTDSIWKCDNTEEKKLATVLKMCKTVETLNLTPVNYEQHWGWVPRLPLFFCKSYVS